MKACTTLLRTLPLSLFLASGAHAGPMEFGGMFGCNSVFGKTGQVTWLVGVDLKAGNLLTTKLTTDKTSDSDFSFGAATVSIRDQVVGPVMTKNIAADDPLTFCKDLSASVGSHLQLHWPDKTTPEVIVEGGGKSHYGCFYGTINDPYTSGINPFLACAMHERAGTNADDLISRGYKKIGADQVKTHFCRLAVKDHNLDYTRCMNVLDNLPIVYPDFAQQINSTEHLKY